MSCSFCVAFNLEPKMCVVHCTKSDSLPQDLYTMTLLVGHHIFSSIFDHLRNCDVIYERSLIIYRLKWYGIFGITNILEELSMTLESLTEVQLLKLMTIWSCYFSRNRNFEWEIDKLLFAILFGHCLVPKANVKLDNFIQINFREIMKSKILKTILSTNFVRFGANGDKKTVCYDK